MADLLLLSCGARKRADAGVLPAIERYTGPRYQVLRRYLRAQPASAPAVAILLAEFGLLHACEPIPWYDRRMTPARAAELRPAVLARLRQLLQSAPYDELCICAGSTYMASLSGYEALLPVGVHVRQLSGPPGKQLRTLKEWLYARPGAP
jgi:hypothetical protein